MADLPYDLYAVVDHEVSRGGRASDISIDQLSPGLNVREAKGDYQSDLSTNHTLTSRPGGIAPSFRSFGSLKLRLICVCLHLLLVIVHLALVVVWWYHFEHRIVVPLPRSGNTSSVIVAISQVVAMVCARPVCMSGC